MVDSNLEVEKDDAIELQDIQKESDRPVLRREPSFSRWFDEDGVIHFDRPLEHADETVEDSDFELPFLQTEGQESKLLSKDRLSNPRNMHLNGNHTMPMVRTHNHVDENTNGLNYVPFDIENESIRELPVSDFDAHDSSSRGSHKTTLDTQNSLDMAIVLKTLFFILVWYTFSTCLTIYNKTLLGEKLGKFPAPMLMNTIHFGMQAVLSNFITWFWSNRFQPTVTMSWKDYFMRVVPTALGTALDINLSNASLVFISITFATMCKSASPIFLLLFAFAFKLESPSVKLLGIISVISVGILLTDSMDRINILTTVKRVPSYLRVQKLPECCKGNRVSILGIRICYACCCHVWVSLVHDSDSFAGLKNPLTLMSYVTPVMAVATAILSLAMDPWDEFRKNIYFDSSWHVFRSALLMFLGGTLAFFMVLTEYILVSATSAVTVTIAGVVKEVVTILVAVFYFHDKFTWLKGVGLFIIIFGVSLFNWYKYQKHQERQTSVVDESGLSPKNVAAKYVILEEMEDHDVDT
ncbi:hypothetical protein C5167_036797 [Papaver somniferum]|uniref:Sugar phosphate transporter domain-containing protein n=1 Tax=Papaver somniferum TaxID=3469 RepID=A0A4Y7I8W7_PAPSO|nr:hypothetical protein C5167_036797 [Papaver somniferum]